MKVRVCVLVGYGINCDYETKYAFELVGAEAKRVHINELIERKDNLENYHIFVIPGGFSYGDDIAAGKVLANKMKTYIHEQIEQFIKDKKLIMGICNGFQAMVKYPLLPKFDGQLTSLTFNDSARLEDRWVYLKVNKVSSCVFLKDIETIYLPIRHAEGKFVVRDKAVLDELVATDQIAVQYAKPNGDLAQGKFPYNPNGSIMDIAGICDSSGRIFGMMPHPEAFLHFTNHPRWTRIKEELRRKGKPIPEEGEGLKIFRNAVEYVSNNL